MNVTESVKNLEEKANKAITRISKDLITLFENYDTIKIYEAFSIEYPWLDVKILDGEKNQNIGYILPLKNIAVIRHEDQISSDEIFPFLNTLRTFGYEIIRSYDPNIQLKDYSK